MQKTEIADECVKCWSFRVTFKIWGNHTVLTLSSMACTHILSCLIWQGFIYIQLKNRTKNGFSIILKDIWIKPHDDGGVITASPVQPLEIKKCMISESLNKYCK